MRSCSVCGYDNPENVNSCLRCHTPLGRNCPACGTLIPLDNKFCGQCGARLPENQTPLAETWQQDQVGQNLQALMSTALADKISAASIEILGEHREVTVLFLDITNFTSTSQKLDREDVFLWVDEVMRLLVNIVYKYEGTIDKFTGDGLMALFGAPAAHENDPERAVRAGLEMQAALQPLQARVKEQYGFDFEVRIGINTGLVIAGQVGNDLHMEYTVIGSTVNLAARLESAAQPGTVLVSYETYQRTRPLFNYRALPRLNLKGIAEPVQVFQPLALRQKPGPVRGLPGLQVPMVGRTQDLARLQDALVKMQRESYRYVGLITGEAGLGKSRLVTEFRTSLSPSKVKVYQGSCLAHTRATPLWVIIDLVRNILQLNEKDPREAQLEMARAYLERLNLAVDKVLPYLLNLLGLGQLDPSVEARLALLDATMLQQQTYAALRQLLLSETRQTPTILIFEDMHWVDLASRSFLEYLIKTTDRAPLLLIFISRDPERETNLQPLLAAAQQDAAHLIEIHLQPLSASETLLLIEQLIKQTNVEARVLKKHIAERAEGNPFYIEEIIRMLIDEEVVRTLIEQGELASETMVWQVTSRTQELLNEVPGTVKGLILARVDRLPEHTRRTLQKAAVAGVSFPVRLLQQLNGDSPYAIAAQLEELAARQFLIAKPFGAEPGYAFRHALIQEAVYRTLLKRDRSKIHTRIAQVIERNSLWSPEEQTEILAHHYAQSTNPAKAIPYLAAVADKAAQLCAYETAIRYYRQAMLLLPTQAADPGEEFFQIRLGLGRSLKFVGEFDTASQILLEVLQHLDNANLAAASTLRLPILVECLRQLADVRQREGAYDQALAYLEQGLQALGVAAPQEHPQLWRSLLDRLAWVRFRQGQLEEGLSLARMAINSLDPEEVDDPIRLASLYNTLGGICWQQGKLDEAMAHVEYCLKLYETSGYYWGTAIAYGNLGILADIRGNWSRAVEYHERAYALQQLIGDLESQARTLDNLGILRMAMGEHEAARQDLEASLQIRQRLGDNFGLAQAQASLAQLAVIQSRLAEAMTHLNAGLTLSNAIGSNEIQVQVRWLLALVHGEKHEFEAGLQLAQEALAMARTAEFMEGEIDCLRVLGRLYAFTDNFAEATTLLGDSIELANQFNDPYRQSLALLELGRVYQRQAQQPGLPNQGEWAAQARNVLNEAVQKFASLGATFDLHLAQAVLSELA